MAAKKEGRTLANNTESYAYFIDRVKAKLHVVLCFSPVGKKFSRWAQQVRGWAGRCANSWWGAAGMSLV